MQPLAGSVTVRVYVPASIAEISSFVLVKPFGPTQLYVAPEVVLPPLMAMLVTEQVNVPPPLTDTFGVVVFKVTFTASLAEQFV